MNSKKHLLIDLAVVLEVLARAILAVSTGLLAIDALAAELSLDYVAELSLSDWCWFSDGGTLEDGICDWCGEANSSKEEDSEECEFHVDFLI